MNYILVFFTISFLFILHEAGHLLAAKWAKIPVARFSIGFGRRLLGFRHKGTEYMVSLIPFGGYVMLDVEDEHAYFMLSLRKRVLFALGGPAVNIIGAVICLSLVNVMDQGISLNAAIIQPLHGTWQLAVKMWETIPMIFSSPDQLSSIVGIVAIGGQYIEMNINWLFHFSVLLNVNLAIFNLLPIPPFDGSKIVMGIVEKIYTPFRRLELPLTIGGWAILIGLMLYATALDIARIAGSMVA